ncbi:hypothetical protein MMPV_009393 [Pyropia vietnamensis]
MASTISIALRRGLALHRAALVPARAAAAGAVAPPPPVAFAAAAAAARRWQSSLGGTAAVSNGNHPPSGDDAESSPPADAAPGATGDDAAAAAAAAAGVPAAAGAVADTEAGGSSSVGAADTDVPASPVSATTDGDVAPDGAVGGNAEATAKPANRAARAPARDKGGGGGGRYSRLPSLELIPSRRTERVKSMGGGRLRERSLPAGLRDPFERRFLLLRGPSGVASRVDVALFLASVGVHAAAVPRGEEGGLAPAASTPAPSADAPAVTPDADAEGGSASAGAGPDAANAAAADTDAGAPAVDANADTDAVTYAPDTSSPPSAAAGIAAALSPPNDAAVVAASRIARLSFNILHNRSDWVVELPSEAAATEAVALTQGRLLGLMLIRSSAVSASMVWSEGGASFLMQSSYPGAPSMRRAKEEGRLGADVAAGVSEDKSAADARAGGRDEGSGGGGGGRGRRALGAGVGVFPNYCDRARAVVVRSRVPLGNLDIFSLFSGYEVARLLGDPNVSKAVLVLMRTPEEAERVAMDKCHGGATVEGINVSVRLFM